MSTLAVVEAILRDVAMPLSVREIVERAAETLPTKSKTPDTVVARDLSMDIKKKGEASTFVRTSPGRYAIRELVMRQQSSTSSPAAAPNLTNGTSSVDSQSEQASTSPTSPTSIVGSALVGERNGTRPAQPQTAPAKSPATPQNGNPQSSNKDTSMSA